MYPFLVEDLIAVTIKAGRAAMDIYNQDLYMFHETDKNRKNC